MTLKLKNNHKFAPLKINYEKIFYFIYSITDDYSY